MTIVELNKTHLVVLALHALGGESDLEHIAVKAHEMFPREFCWRSFPQFPDKDAVRVHLSEAKKETFGGLVIDRDLRTQKRGTSGYTKRFALTPAGVARAVELRAALPVDASDRPRVRASANSLEYKRLIQPIFASRAYQEFVSGGSIEKIGRDNWLAAFKLFPDASPFVITGRISRAASLVSDLDEAERDSLQRFIDGGRNAFKL